MSSAPVIGSYHRPYFFGKNRKTQNITKMFIVSGVQTCQWSWPDWIPRNDPVISNGLIRHVQDERDAEQGAWWRAI